MIVCMRNTTNCIEKDREAWPDLRFEKGNLKRNFQTPPSHHHMIVRVSNPLEVRTANEQVGI